jgi:hypothetical protein
VTARAPIGAPALWRAVVDRDGGRCTCTGGCGRRHPQPDRTRGTRGRGPGANATPGPVGRCPAGTGGTPERLYVVPADPTLERHAWTLPATAVTTRCQDCATATVTAAARRAASSSTAAAGTGPTGRGAGAPDPDVLFELPPGPGGERWW